MGPIETELVEEYIQFGRCPAEPAPPALGTTVR